MPKVVGSALGSLKLGTEEGFVLSRIDGRVTIAEICLLVPFDAEVTATILMHLAKLGAIEVPGGDVARPLKPLKPATPATPVATTQMDGIELTVAQARRIDEFFASLDTRDAFELLEVTREADKKEIKRAYFKLSKEFHPDRFFNKSIGVYKERLSKIFQSIKAAFELLNDDARRAAYLESAGLK